MSSVTWKEVTQHLALVDALDLRGERRHLAMIGIDTGHSQDHDWHRAAYGSNDSLCGRLGLRIRPLRPDRPVFADWHARLARRMDEHRIRVDELLDLEGLQCLDQFLSAANIDLVVPGIGFAGEVKESSQMNHRGDAIAVALAQLRASAYKRLVRGDISWRAPAGITSVSVVVAGTLWICAFGIFIVVYTPILVKPRIDGRQG